MHITELDVWKSAIELSKMVFDAARKFPETESNGIGFQLRQSVTQIPSNIASAASRKQGKDAYGFLFNARYSLYHVETLLYLAERMGYLNGDEMNTLLEHLDSSRRLLFGFIKHYRRADEEHDHHENHEHNDKTDY